MERSDDGRAELRPKLHQAQETLEDALDEVCASKPVQQETTGEMIRLEESLSVAAEAAKHAVSLRRRLREEQERQQDARRGADASNGEAPPPRT